MKKWQVILVIVILVVALLALSKKSFYTPERTSETVLPFIEPSAEESDEYSTSTVFPVQTEVFSDTAGSQNMRENLMADFIQGDPTSNVGEYGDFTGIESSAGAVLMTVIPSGDQYTYTRASSEYIPDGHKLSSFIVSEQPVSSTSPTVSR